MIEDIFELLSQQLTDLRERFSVESLDVFGSVGRGAAGPTSDVDILVRYRVSPGMFAFLDLKMYLEGVIGRPVDLVTEGALKEELRNKILQEAVRVT